ncbi:DUF397 domain-containing protein [Actinoplanes sp. NBC_00393]|uniref:DUF397 domain-containing protein n=1 Tax=Actinoplanes sp. NBC_00393 TaxID=2975953 RepID=UPI002E201B25
MNDTTMKWERSSFCATGACVEVAAVGDDRIAMRDSKNLGQPALQFSRADWDVFLDQIAAQARLAM